MSKEKYIQVKYQPSSSIYGRTMPVCLSNHPRFKVGSRFDYGFMGIATKEGYEISVFQIGIDLAGKRGDENVEVRVDSNLKGNRFYMAVSEKLFSEIEALDPLKEGLKNVPK